VGGGLGEVEEAAFVFLLDFVVVVVVFWSCLWRDDVL
jgi:hypothetical protein